MSEQTERMKRRVEAAHAKEIILLNKLIDQEEYIKALEAQVKRLKTQLANLEGTQCV